MPTVPTNVLIQYTMVGQLLTNSGPNAYQNVYWDVYGAPDLTGEFSGYVGQLQNISVSATANISAPQSGVVVPTSPAGGDLGANYPNPTVIAIQGQPVATTPPTSGQGLFWNGTQYVPTTPASGFTAGGDLSGTSTSQNVIKVHGASVPLAGALTTGNVLQVLGGASLGYAPLALGGGGNYVTGVLPTANQAAQSMGGDVTGTTATATVAKVNGVTISGTPSAGQAPIASSSSAAAWGALPSGGANDTNGFRLTLTSGVPVTTTDVTGAGTLYCTPFHSSQIALFVSSAWTVLSSAQFSLALTLTSGKNYDVFVFGNAGVATLELSAAWTNDATRADALAMQDGIWVKSADHARRYVGTLRATGTNTTEDSQLNRFLYNYRNQQPRPMLVTDSTANWNSPIGGWHQARGVTTNNVNYVVGMAYERISATVQSCESGSNASNNSVGVGIDSSSVNSAGLFGSGAQTGGALPTLAFYRGTPGLGYHQIVWLEWIGTAGEFYGQANGIANQISGMSAEVNA